MTGEVYSERLGQVLLSQGIVTYEQLEHALREQAKKPYLRIGEILFTLGYLTFTQLEEQLEQQYRDMRLGQLLVRKGLLDSEQLEHAMVKHEETGLLLGHLVVKLGFCTLEQVSRVLEEQRILSGTRPLGTQR
ncbi:MAG: hypothetical protein HY692_07870 [Cyanobacteria bacterium NC_groundwater_1444_Ag_S-0.65um_54_12]|nr:hypothetical protein [Cyanobacteria bacterium NC_groundwater_1444_Ag_S-0.65um_54_12]